MWLSRLLNLFITFFYIQNVKKYTITDNTALAYKSALIQQFFWIWDKNESRKMPQVKWLLCM